MRERKHYLRAGDTVKTRIPAGKDFPKGSTGVIESTDGEYVYVKLKAEGHTPLVTCEYYRSELDLVEAVSDNGFKKAEKLLAKQIIKIHKESIKESEKTIKKMQKILDS